MGAEAELTSSVENSRFMQFFRALQDKIALYLFACDQDTIHWNGTFVDISPLSFCELILCRTVFFKDDAFDFPYLLRQIIFIPTFKWFNSYSKYLTALNFRA